MTPSLDNVLHSEISTLLLTVFAILPKFLSLVPHYPGLSMLVTRGPVLGPLTFLYTFYPHNLTRSHSIDTYMSVNPKSISAPRFTS